MDKLYHLIVGIIIGIITYTYFYGRGKSGVDSIWLSLFIVLFVAIGKEVYDIEYGTVDLFDILYTVIGGWVGSFIMTLYLDKSK